MRAGRKHTHLAFNQATKARKMAEGTVRELSNNSTDEMTIATTEMCAEAFATILSRVRPEQANASAMRLPTSSGGIFVTWSIPRGRNNAYTLRGCIGTLKASPINTGVPRYASHAAFNDPRFDPIGADELVGLKVGVSVLSMFERAAHAYDWTIGVHGIILEFGNGRFSATYLPEVCKDHGWSKEHCIQSLAEKAGYRGRFEGQMFDEAILTRYQSTKAELVYEQYLQMLQD